MVGHAAESQWVRAEADFARNAGKLVQAQVDGTMPPMPFNQIQCADLKGWRGGASHAGWVKLRGSVEALSRARSGRNPRGSTGRDPGSLSLAVAASFALVAGGHLSVCLRGSPASSASRYSRASVPDLDRMMREPRRRHVGGHANGDRPQPAADRPGTQHCPATGGERRRRSKKAADYLVEASVRTAGNRIRVSADLVRTSDGEQVWSQDFDRKLDESSLSSRRSPAR